MSFMTQTAIGVVVKRSSRRSFPPNHYISPLSNVMIKNAFPDSSKPFPSYTLLIPFMGGSSTTSS